MKRKSLLFLGLVLAVIISLKSVVLAKNSGNFSKDERGPLTKITFIHYKKSAGKTGVGKTSKNTSCYQFLANGARWKKIEPYLINPQGSSLPESFVKQTIGSGVAEWEKYGGDIFGEGQIDYEVSYNNGFDGKNTVSFDNSLDENIIAQTTVWGYFSGSPRLRELVEWDILFNSKYIWGDAELNSSLMDLQNIATHELGHSAGMADLYETGCSQETMYGYSDYGETLKRTLNLGDVKGIQELY